MPETLDLPTFHEALHTWFLIEGAPVELALELISVTDLGSTPAQEQFSAIFRGPVSAFLPQQTYPVVHETLGRFPLFLVPVARDAEGFRYEAIFNRLRGGPA